jgi:dihydrofolate synthase/folylpolyglutamate synthase
MLAEMLMLSGLRVGLYTSPHLHCFTERIRIDGTPLDRSEVAGLAETIRQVAVEIPVTFFEATTAMALLAFRERQVDIAVIETGLGGRLDATNIVEPQLCLSTPVSLDHSEQLGENLAAIAMEKAGIIKPGVPVVIGRQAPEAAEVLQKTAANCAAVVHLAERDFSWQGDHEQLSIEVHGQRFDGLSCALAGEHQLDNFAQAVAAATELRRQGVEITDEAIREAGRSIVWPGRLEWLGAGRRVLLDASHNLAGTTCLADYLEQQGVSRIRLVAGLSGGRDPDQVLMPLAKYATTVYAVPVSCDQPVKSGLIAAWAEKLRLPVSEYSVAKKALIDALDAAGCGEPVVVCGSLFLVAELRQLILEGEVPVRT